MRWLSWVLIGLQAWVLVWTWPDYRAARRRLRAARRSAGIEDSFGLEDDVDGADSAAAARSTSIEVQELWSGRAVLHTRSADGRHRLHLVGLDGRVRALDCGIDDLGGYVEEALGLYEALVGGFESVGAGRPGERFAGSVEVVDDPLEAGVVQLVVGGYPCMPLGSLDGPDRQDDLRADVTAVVDGIVRALDDESAVALIDREAALGEP